MNNISNDFTIENMICEMKEYSLFEEYEKAKGVLDKLKEILVKPSDYQWTILKVGRVETLKDISDMLYSNSIRITPEQIGFSNFLNLIVSLGKKKSELQGLKYTDINRKRKIVAEKMVCLGISIPRKKRGINKMPNRAFLDIAYTINPDLCRQELGRREQVNLWKALESGDNLKIITAKSKLKKYYEK